MASPQGRKYGMARNALPHKPHAAGRHGYVKDNGKRAFFTTPGYN